MQVTKPLLIPLKTELKTKGLFWKKSKKILTFRFKAKSKKKGKRTILTLKNLSRQETNLFQIPQRPTTLL